MPHQQTKTIQSKCIHVHATKAYDGVEVRLHSFLILALDGVGGQLHDTTALLPVK
jgi:hypothetical protein